MQMSSLIYSGDSEAEIIFIDAMITNYGWYCAVQRGGKTFWLGDRLNHRMPLGLV